MKHVLAFLLIVSVIDVSAQAMDRINSQANPESLIRSFFAALKSNDERTLIGLLAPKRREMAADAKFWQYWLSVWSMCEVVKFVGSHESVASTYDETVRVPVEYKCVDRPNFTNSIPVSRVGKVWYWDAN